MDCDRGRPSLPQLVSEGIVLKGESEIVEKLKKEANDLLIKGPDKWTEETMKQKRYFISDTLDDFIGASKEKKNYSLLIY